MNAACVGEKLLLRSNESAYLIGGSINKGSINPATAVYHRILINSVI
jgi:hypothetical protein